MMLDHLGAGFEVRLWEGDGSGDFHAKLFAWRTTRRTGEAWIGSATSRLAV